MLGGQVFSEFSFQTLILIFHLPLFSSFTYLKTNGLLGCPTDLASRKLSEAQLPFKTFARTGSNPVALSGKLKDVGLE